MTYSFSVPADSALTRTIPTKEAVTGFTLTVEFSKNSDFQNIAFSKAATGTGKTATIVLTSGETTAVGDAYYRIKGVNGPVTEYLQNGKIDYVEADQGSALLLSQASALFSPYRAMPVAAPQAALTVVSTMESGWTKLDQGTLSFDTSVYEMGTGSMKAVLSGGVGDKTLLQRTFTAQDWSNSGFSMRLRSDNWAGMLDGYIIVSTSGTFTQFFRMQFTPKMQRRIDNEWIEITFTRGDFDFNSGTASWATVNGVRIQLWAVNGQTPSVWMDQLVRYTTPAAATVSFAFDDGFAGVYTAAKPTLDKYGYRGTVFVMPTALGTSAYMTQSNIDALHQAGWDISGHGVTDLTTMTLAEAEEDVQAMKAYLVDHGYKGGDVYAYPLGGQNFAIRTMVAKYFSAARGTSIFGQSRSYVTRRNFMGRQLGPAIATATVQSWVDLAIANKEWLIITGHAIRTPTSTAEDYTPTNFTTVVDYIASTGVNVLPVSEALAQIG